MNAHTTKRRPSGFTLVELLVVITIIGVLMSLVMPAVNSAMETMRNLQCKNNLTQLNTAIDIFCAEKGGRYPGHTNQMVHYSGNTRTVSGVSWIVSIMPNLGQQELYDDIQNKKNSERYIELLTCPSNTPDSMDEPSCAYKINAGLKGGNEDEKVNLSNGIAFDSTGNMPLYNKKDTIYDGTSYTLLLCETEGIGKWNAAGQSGGGFVWERPTRETKPINNTRKKNDHPGSKHASSGANVVFCDSACKTLSESIAYEVYQQLMTPNARESDMPNKEIIINEIDL